MNISVLSETITKVYTFIGDEIQATGHATASSILDLNTWINGPHLAFDEKTFDRWLEPELYNLPLVFYDGFKSSASFLMDYNQWLQFSFDVCVRVFHVVLHLDYGDVSRNLGISTMVETLQ